MKHIIVGTDRQDSNSFKVGLIVQKIYENLGEAVEIIDLKEFKKNLHLGTEYGQEHPEEMKPYFKKIVESDGLILIIPEYNGSMPGILKYFIDHMKFPDSFEFRPVCFIGLGGMFGGLRPVEHLQQVFGYRNAFIYPLRVFMINVWKVLQDGQITDPVLNGLLLTQAKGFRAFTTALRSESLDANSVLQKKGVLQ